MRILLILLLVFVACEASSAQKRPVPAVQIAEGVVWRQSPNKNASGMSQPPFKEVTITNISGFKQKPVTGAAVTVIALGSDLSPLRLRIRTTHKAVDPCDEKLPVFWDVESGTSGSLSTRARRVEGE
jgi:hypothetical protein